MEDLISRQAAIDALDKRFNSIPMEQTTEILGLRKDLRELPSAEVEPVKRGKWIISSSNAEGVCTNCQYKIYGRPYNNTYLIVPYNYCPNCGARMREEVEE